MNKCEKCAKLKSVRCAECVRRAKSDGSVIKNMRQVLQFQDGTIQPSTPFVNTQVKGRENAKESKFNFNKEGSNKKKNVTASICPTVSKFKNIQTYISSNNLSPNNYFVGKVGREENSNNLTPTKRKLILEKQVSKLVPVFDFGIASVGESESPAKRRKYAPGVN